MTERAGTVFSSAVVLPHRIFEAGYVACRDGIIVAVGDGEPPPEFAGLPRVAAPHVAPVCVDIHVHGGANADYMDGTEQAANGHRRTQ